MVDNTSILKTTYIVGTVLLGMVCVISILGYCFIFGYMYLNNRNIYSNHERKQRYELLAFLLPITGLLSGIVILMIWNPLTRSLFFPLVIFAVFMSIILWQSIVGPYQMAGLLGKFNAWRKKNNKKE